MWSPSRLAPAPACPTVPRSSRVSDELPGGAQTLVLATSLSPSRSSSPPPDKRRCSPPSRSPCRAERCTSTEIRDSSPLPIQRRPPVSANFCRRRVDNERRTRVFPRTAPTGQPAR
ncbi:pollen-specific leucine-rich repeat extensin-like protein 4 [Iris pallida]|uniref:Pollen-specific leucine-rich repeat extensin-like protein 4 n=1 Tax=Iris pallida TaxID=29817 RepID=A0AAX6FU43_IRIPA|nr:pollen-specific leucine-rich repeat extensin-like protein 4 [Iris pallida]